MPHSRHLVIRNGPAVRIETVNRPDLIGDAGRYLAYMQFTGAFCLTSSS